MKKYYMIYTDHSGLNGVPIYLNARLWENIENKKDLMEPYSVSYDWESYIYQKENFPSKLYFIVQAPKISFDYYQYHSGLIVSKEFLEFLSAYTNDFTYVPLEVYSNKMKIITKKEYYFLKFNSYIIDGFDYKNSIYTANKSDNGEIIMINSHPWISEVKKLVLNHFSINNRDVFCLHGWIFFNTPFVSEEVVEKAIDLKLYGLKYVAVDKIVDFFYNRDSRNKKEQIIE